MPKTTVNFNAQLGVNLTKKIELTNPSKKTVTYQCSIHGSQDFVFNSKEMSTIRIDSKSSFTFPVTFLSRFSRSSEAQLSFISRREGNVHAAAISFKLKSNCVAKKPRKIVRLSSIVYEVGAEDVEIENPFDEDVEFRITLGEPALLTEFPVATAGGSYPSVFGENNDIPSEKRVKSKLAH